MADRERVYEVTLKILVYVDPDGLPAEDTTGFKEIMAEHCLEFLIEGLGGDLTWIADYNIDGVELVEERPIGTIV